MRRIVVLGSTGSIGRQTLDVVRILRERFEVIGLAAGHNLELLRRQVDEFNPKAVAFESRENSGESATTQEWPARISLEEMASLPEADLVVLATSGKAGLPPLMAAIRAGKPVALSNKEALVMAGELVTGEARRRKVRLLPVDSEHSAIWQCLRGERQKPRRLILTASGGPFASYTQKQLDRVTPEQALRHPTWTMGRKVTIDSATLMNKGMEVIEAHWLFRTPVERIGVLIHPQSIIHSMVEFEDGCVKAQLSRPDMRLPIQYALTYPDRVANTDLPWLNWTDSRHLTFEQPDLRRFPCLRLALEAARTGGTAATVLCASDEIAVEAFLSGQIPFTGIARVVETTLQKHHSVAHPSLEDVMQADNWARITAARLASGVRS